MAATPQPPWNDALVGPYTILVFVPHATAAVRFFDDVFRLLLARGHRVVLAFDKARDADPDAFLAEFLASGRVEWLETERFPLDERLQLVRRLRRSADFVRFLGPDFAQSPWLIERSRTRAPRYLRWLLRLPLLRSPGALRGMYRAYGAMETALPPSRDVDALLDGVRPDVVLVCPNLMPGSEQTAYVGNARAKGIPVAVSVPSWDNLLTKQQIRPLPDRVLVWNELQREEAVRMHDIPAESVVVTGAQCFDRWFGWVAGSRAEFCNRVGLDPDRPFLLYTCGSLARNEDEAAFVRTWATAIRGS
ncbi:MAG: hypothetical protein H0T13_02280, partial [Actinobacteria bacterium]|nr:hypothetical protein [Actinomycetota bacterium]